METVTVNNIKLSNTAPLTLLAGMNVLEDLDTALHVGHIFKEACATHSLPYIFKASYDKANRSSISSFRGPGLEKGLQMLADIKSKLNVPIITDIHEPAQAAPVAEVADILQIPAFLCRQTDLIQAAAATGKPIQVKKAQFLAPQDCRNIIDKLAECGNKQVILCERGTSFGYNNLVVDPLTFPLLKQMNVPVTFDVTHALQQPGGLGQATGGRRQFVFPLMKAGVSQGLAGLFVEAHPAPDKAKCDGPCALPTAHIPAFIGQAAALDQLVKSQPEVNVI